MERTVAQKIKERIAESFQAMDWPASVDWQVYASEKPEHGHYATNAAMVLAAKMKKPPMELAEQLAGSITDFKTEAVKPGFVNFFLEADFLCQEWRNLDENLEQQLRTPNRQNIQVEFVSANPTGPLTLGNGRGGFFGDALGNVLRRVGHEVVKEYYVNDAGFQVQRLGESVLGLPEAPYQGDYIEELRRRNKADDPQEAGRQAADHILEKMIKPDIDKIGLKFDVWFSERDLYRNNLVEKTLIELKDKNLTEEKEGAVWLKTTLFGDEKNRVLVKATGEMTYLMTDLAYHRNKFDRGFDRIIDIWGADHQGHVQPLFQGLEALGHDPDRLKILIAQWVKVMKGGRELRISKRRGDYITIAELVDQVGLDAVRYFFLDRSLNSHLNFDFDLAVKRSAENPVYYIQYAHARISSILRKTDLPAGETTGSKMVLDHPTELDLIAKLLDYPETVLAISENYDVHKLPQYVYNLASTLHRFYRDCPVATAEPEQRSARLSLLATVQRILREGLGLMGIQAPDKM